MNIENFVNTIGSNFFTGVPDSQLKSLCDYLIFKYGTDAHHHIIAANEGNAVALAAGYHLSTRKYPVVYMQNSGEGNAVNPMASLMDEHVYGIPAIYVIGWRGEPGVHDEPQHVYQGMITCKLLELMNISYMVIDKNTTDDEMQEKMKDFSVLLSQGKSVAFVIKKGALSNDNKVSYHNDYVATRESVIDTIIKYTGEDPIVSTTGKASRELFELREKYNQGHQHDFLTVGSMGHSSSIALGIAINKPEKRIWCIDGDGALLMHMGSMTCIGNYAPDNLIHIVINNEAHETVGGMPTNTKQLDLLKIAEACGYKKCYKADNLDALNTVLSEAIESKVLTFIEVKASIGARADLGRPTTTAKENKNNFINFLNKELASTNCNFSFSPKHENIIEKYNKMVSSLKNDYRNKDYHSSINKFIEVFNIKKYDTPLSLFPILVNSGKMIKSKNVIDNIREQCCTEEMAIGDEIFSLLISEQIEYKSICTLFDKLIKLHFNNNQIIDLYNESFKVLCLSVINKMYIDTNIKPETVHDEYIMLSGYGWSGSGAVRDFLNEFENIENAGGEWPIIESSLGFKGLIDNINNWPALRKSAILLFFTLLGSFRLTSDLWSYKPIITSYRRCHSEQFALAYAEKFYEISHIISNIVVDTFKQNSMLVKEHLTWLCNSLIQLICINVPRNKKVIIDNSVHLYNIDVLNYCTNVKFIGVVRDPRSNFVARVNECPSFMMNSESYVKYIIRILTVLYEKFNNLPEDTKKCIRLIHFEDFVLKQEERDNIINFLGIPNSDWILKEKIFKPNESIKNVYLHQSYPNKNDINIIERLTSDYCYNFSQK